MRVKRLEITGFKSFAERTLLDFSSSLSAVVGPNGCGKSNVVDAVRWVLGEQSVRTLRGKSMEDVIFNGSEQRRPISMAEVSIVFENQGTVTSPQFADLQEIMITRRLFRSGDSEYLINKHACRLKDIQQLLMDTGLGNRAYAIIEQGKVAAFIEARPETRRLWLEEAAGITRLKNQKQISQSKVEEAEVNLKIVDNRLADLSKQMEHLAHQSKKALAYQDLKNRIRTLDMQAASFEFQQQKQRLNVLGQELEQKHWDALGLGQQIDKQELAQKTLGLELVDLERELALLGAKRGDNREAIGKYEGELRQLEQRINDYASQKSQMSREETRLREKIAAMEEDWRQAASLWEEAKGWQEKALTHSREAVAQLQAAEKETWESQSALDRCKDNLRDSLSREVQTRNRLADLEQNTGNLKRQEEQQSSRARRLEEDIAVLENSLAADESRMEMARERLKDSERMITGLAGAKEEDSRQLNRLRREEQDFNRKHQQLAIEYEAKETSLASYDWAQVAVRKILQGKDSLPFTPLGVVAEKLNVVPGCEAMVEAALGADLQALMLADYEQVLRLSKWLEDKNYGRVRVIILGDLQDQAVSYPAGSNPLGKMVNPEPGFEMLAHLWAGAGQWQGSDIWQAALAPGQIVVGAKGERLDRPGAASLGQGNMGALLSRRTQLHSLAAAREEARLIWEEAAQARRQAEADLAELENDFLNQRQAYQEQERCLRDRERELIITRESAGQKRRDLDSIIMSRDYNQEELGRYEAEMAGLNGLLLELEKKRADTELRLRSVEEKIIFDREKLETARKRDLDTRVELNNSQNQLDNADRDNIRLQNELEENREQMASLGRHLSDSGKMQQTLTGRCQECREFLEDLYAQSALLDDSHRQLNNRHEELMTNKQLLDGEVHQLQTRQKAAEMELQKIRSHISQLEMSQQNLCQQIEERCLLDLRLCHEENLPAGTDFSLSQAKEDLQKLRGQFNRLGPVNLEAINDFEALRENRELLLTQKDDVEKALADIHKAVRDINQRSRSLFLTTMDEVNQQLSLVFPVLMGGGSARLVLHEDTDPLEAGLDILVELPGKRVKNLEAMSGGEKALSAIAVLFALFLIRPAPFCILDEVDAPLDEANVDRFQALLRQLTEHSQILMITHNRRTMEMVDMLYGVTMQEKGVSKMLAVTVGEASEESEDHVAGSLVVAA
ncbi:MAG: chromosome segregation protein SMC [Desulfarculales bacterium]|jgi:chromosome segregation protein|nr:chromosome segregation protein SMC [Desulfarculales bacterium]